jgi:NAD(P)-dependent dehydrogenase (short-subunit alcohol dehydrogenase family)
MVETDPSNRLQERAFEKCVDLFGGVDVVVNNAGIDGEVNWEVQLQVNLFVSHRFYSRSFGQQAVVS